MAQALCCPCLEPSQGKPSSDAPDTRVAQPGALVDTSASFLSPAPCPKCIQTTGSYCSPGTAASDLQSSALRSPAPPLSQGLSPGVPDPEGLCEGRRYRRAILSQSWPSAL